MASNNFFDIKKLDDNKKQSFPIFEHSQSRSSLIAQSALSSFYRDSSDSLSDIFGSVSSLNSYSNSSPLNETYSSDESGHTYSSDGPGYTYSSDGPGQTYSSDGSGQTYSSDGPGQTYSSDGPGQTYSSDGPGQTYSSDGSGQTYSSDGSGQTYSSDGPGQTYSSDESEQAYSSDDSGQAYSGEIHSTRDYSKPEVSTTKNAAGQTVHMVNKSALSQLSVQEVKQAQKLARAADIGLDLAKSITYYITRIETQANQVVNVHGYEIFFADNDVAYLKSKKLGQGYYSTAYLGAGIKREQDKELNIESIVIKLLNNNIFKKNLYEKSKEKRENLGNHEYLQAQPKYVGSMNGIPIIVEKLYADGDMSALKFDGKKDSPLTALEFAANSAHGLAYIHEQGKLHGDLKLNNIFRGGIVGDLDTVIRDSTIRDLAHSHHRVPYADTEVLLHKKTKMIGDYFYIDKATVQTKHWVVHPKTGAVKSKYLFTQKTDLYALGAMLLELAYAILDEAKHPEDPDSQANQAYIAHADPRLSRNRILIDKLQQLSGISKLDDFAIFRHNELLQNFEKDSTLLLQAVSHLDNQGGFSNQPCGMEVVTTLFDLGRRLINEDPDQRPSASSVAKELHLMKDKLQK